MKTIANTLWFEGHDPILLLCPGGSLVAGVFCGMYTNPGTLSEFYLVKRGETFAYFPRALTIRLETNANLSPCTQNICTSHLNHVFSPSLERIR